MAPSTRASKETESANNPHSNESDIQGLVLPYPDTLESSFPTTGPNEPNRGNVTWHTLFSSNITPTNSLSSGIARCTAKGGILKHHKHEQAEMYFIIQGKGIVFIDGKEFKVKKGDSVFIPGNAEHAIKNDDEEVDLEFLYVFPTNNFEDVVYQFKGVDY